MRRAVIVGLATIVHFVVSVLVLIGSFGAGMARFDTGAPPGVEERALVVVRAITLFPLGLLASMIPGRWFPGRWGYVPFAANSLLWGLTLGAVAPRTWRSMLRR